MKLITRDQIPSHFSLSAANQFVMQEFERIRKAIDSGQISEALASDLHGLPKNSKPPLNHYNAINKLRKMVKDYVTKKQLPYSVYLRRNAGRYETGGEELYVLIVEAREKKRHNGAR